MLCSAANDIDSNVKEAARAKRCDTSNTHFESAEEKHREHLNVRLQKCTNLPSDTAGALQTYVIKTKYRATMVSAI